MTTGRGVHSSVHTSRHPLGTPKGVLCSSGRRPWPLQCSPRLRRLQTVCQIHIRCQICDGTFLGFLLEILSAIFFNF